MQLTDTLNSLRNLVIEDNIPKYIRVDTSDLRGLYEYINILELQLEKIEDDIFERNYRCNALSSYNL